MSPNYDLLIVRKTTQNSSENLDHLSDQQLVEEFYENRGKMEYLKVQKFKRWLQSVHRPFSGRWQRK